MNNRMGKLREKMGLASLDGMIVSNPINLKYLLGIEAEGVLLLTPKENIFITDGRYIEDVNLHITIADEIIVSTNTAKAHVGNILAKLSVKDRAQAVIKAVRHNLF